MGLLRTLYAMENIRIRGLEKNHKKLEKIEREEDKYEMIQKAILEFEDYEETIKNISSISRYCSETWDWDKIKSDEPEAPNYTNGNELFAKLELINYRPSLLDRLLNRVKKKKELITLKIDQAIIDDND